MDSDESGQGRLISRGYRDLNAHLHATETYGARGDKWAGRVTDLVRAHGPRDLLDYGCGKGALKRALAPRLDIAIREYDPAIAGKDSPPDPAGLVVCTDVLEHIEPDFIDAVVADLKRLTRDVLFVVVSTRPARKVLADGRNAHLIVQPLAGWRPLLTAGMTVLDLAETHKEFALTLRKGG